MPSAACEPLFARAKALGLGFSLGYAELTPEGPFDAAVSSFDGLNYLTPQDLRATLAAVARSLRAHGWLVFDLHTDAMMEFTATNPVVSGEADGQAFTIRSVVDIAARTCDSDSCSLARCCSTIAVPTRASRP